MNTGGAPPLVWDIAVAACALVLQVGAVMGASMGKHWGWVDHGRRVTVVCNTAASVLLVTYGALAPSWGLFAGGLGLGVGQQLSVLPGVRKGWTRVGDWIERKIKA